jgi:hypothetical protein
MGADMAIQFMLMVLFQMVSEMADDPRGVRGSSRGALRTRRKLQIAADAGGCRTEDQGQRGQDT